MLVRCVLPPIGEGFSRFLGNDEMGKLLDGVVAAELAEGTQDPYDSHPPLRDRIAAAERLTGAPAPAPAPPVSIRSSRRIRQAPPGPPSRRSANDDKISSWESPFDRPSA